MSILKNDDGQSILEFFMMLPMMIGLSILLVHVDQAIQVSIVDQQYARAWVLYKTFNSPFYPAAGLRSELRGANQMVFGVSDSSPLAPTATEQLISRTPQLAGGASDAGDESSKPKGRVRIRNSVTLCTGPVEALQMTEKFDAGAICSSKGLAYE